MNEERRQVLQMLAEGRITPEQAEQLLEALEEQGREQPSAQVEPPGQPAARTEPPAGTWSIGGIDLDRLVEMKAVGVSPDYIREMQALLGNVSLDELIEMRAVGVSPEFVREVTAIVGKLPINKLVEMRAVGVTPDFLRQWSQVGFDLSGEHGEQAPSGESFSWEWGHLRPPRRAEETGE